MGDVSGRVAVGKGDGAGVEIGARMRVGVVISVGEREGAGVKIGARTRVDVVDVAGIEAPDCGVICVWRTAGSEAFASCGGAGCPQDAKTRAAAATSHIPAAK